MLGEIFWDVVPYVTLAIVIVGTWWRYRYDKFGWTTRSSQLYESRLLRIGSPMFHFGILVVIFGHVIGLLIPESWTDAMGLSHHAYHVQAVRSDRSPGSPPWQASRFSSIGDGPGGRCSWRPPSTTR